MRGRPTDKRTLVPPYDAADLARAIGSSAPRPVNKASPFDHGAYARIVDDHLNRLRSLDASASRETMRVPAAADDMDPSRAPTEAPIAPGIDELTRAMYASYLASEFPDALTLAEHVVEMAPDHALAQAVVSRCRALMGYAASASERSSADLSPSSVLRLRDETTPLEGLSVDARTLVVLHHLDGVSDAGTVADLAGISPVEAVERLHALLDAGVVELVA